MKLVPGYGLAKALAGAGLISLLAACGAASTATPSAPSSPPAAAGAASSGSPQAAGSWDDTVAAAKKESKVVILGPNGSDVQQGLTDPFHRKYPQIDVNYDGPPPPQIPPKLLNEQAAGQHVTDLVIVGTTTILLDLRPAGAIVPVPPYLTGPESKNESKWMGGKFDYADDAGQYNLAFGVRVQIPFIYNPSMVQASDIHSWKDLLDPKWKGKMAMLDPRQAGAGQDMSLFLFTNPKLGKDVLKGLYSQNLILSRDDRQVLDWVGQGKYPIGIGASGVIAYELQKKGLPLEFFPSEQLAEGSFITTSNATIGIHKDPPHPNALKVYLDYLLSQEGQTEWSKGSGLASRRLDVPRDFLPPGILPKDGVTYQENYREQFQKSKDELQAFIKDNLPAS